MVNINFTKKVNDNNDEETILSKEFHGKFNQEVDNNNGKED